MKEIPLLMLLVYSYEDGLVKGVPLSPLEIGSLLVYDSKDRKVLLKVVGFEYVSSVEESRLVERAVNRVNEAFPYPLTPLSEPSKLVAKLKVVAELSEKGPVPFKSYIEPDSFLREPTSEDLSFLSKGGLFLGYLRSGSKRLNIPVKLDPEKVLTKHVIISATTGRGKSNLLKVMLWSLLDEPKVGVLVMDAHREYFEALSKHPNASENLVAFSPYPSRGELELSISTSLIEPSDISGSTPVTEAQFRLMWKFREMKGKEWIKSIFEVEEKELEQTEISPWIVLKAKLSKLLYIVGNECKGVFKAWDYEDNYSLSFLDLVKKSLNEGKVVLIDTSALSEEAELLIGNLIANHMLTERRRRRDKEFTPVVFAIEEAPRVLGKDVPDNAYQRVAREGRKFGLGIIAITQLLTVIPDDILANVNTKIYMGMASGRERRAAIDNAMHDLEGEEEEFAKLNVGEAIMSSSEVGMPVPIYVPDISELIRKVKMVAGQTDKIVEDD